MALYLKTETVSVSGAPSGTTTQDYTLPGTPTSHPQVALQGFDVSYGDNDEKKIHSYNVECETTDWSGSTLTVKVTAGMRDDGQGNTVYSNVSFLIIADIT